MIVPRFDRGAILFLPRRYARLPDRGGALRLGVWAMEVVLDAPARPLGQAVGEVRVVVAVLTVGAEAGVDRGDRAIDRRHGGKIAIRALAKGLLRNRQDLLQDRAVEGESAGDRGAIASAAQQLRAH